MDGCSPAQDASHHKDYSITCLIGESLYYLDFLLKSWTIHSRPKKFVFFGKSGRKLLSLSDELLTPDPTPYPGHQFYISSGEKGNGANSRVKTRGKRARGARHRAANREARGRMVFRCPQQIRNSETWCFQRFVWDFFITETCGKSCNVFTHIFAIALGCTKKKERILT